MADCRWRIRRAEVDDCGKIFGIITDLAKGLNKENDVQVSEQELRDDWSEYECFLAESKKKDSSNEGEKWTVTGGVIFSYFFSIYAGRQMLVVLIYVQPSYRGKGIGRELMKTAAKVAVENGCRKMMWTTSAASENGKVHSFYNSIGAKSTTRFKFLLENDNLLVFSQEESSPRFTGTDIIST